MRVDSGRPIQRKKRAGLKHTHLPKKHAGREKERKAKERRERGSGQGSWSLHSLRKQKTWRGDERKLEKGVQDRVQGGRRSGRTKKMAGRGKEKN